MSSRSSRGTPGGRRSPRVPEREGDLRDRQRGVPAQVGGCATVLLACQTNHTPVTTEARPVPPTPPAHAVAPGRVSVTLDPQYTSYDEAAKKADFNPTGVRLGFPS